VLSLRGLRERLRMVHSEDTLRRQQLADWWCFLRQWWRRPKSTAAIAPSGERLARLMVDELPPGARRVLELGPGTGVFTRAILDRGIAPENLFLVELNESFAALLERRFPAVRVLRGDARELPSLLAAHPEGAPFDAVISGLGLLAMSGADQTRLFSALLAVLAPAGRVIQFSYAPFPPLRRSVRRELGLRARRGAFAWRNLPPARVFVFERDA
jgi:phosphatidylethanolamine/phosphatidyl-N-methylethanolamine N-methyltransferase